jgi:pimeloyl-ACP methyl ester carboxylesterase
VLVGGLGSATGHASVLAVDTKALGYDQRHVIEFSYRADGKPYGPADTQVDINASGAVLAHTLRRIRAANPGVPIDVIAHSQGGLVARVAISEPNAPHVDTVVTLATPHRGANLATAGATIATSERGRALLDEGGRVVGGGTNPLSVSVGQMSANSDFIRSLDNKHIPMGTRAVSIGVRGDLVVPSSRAHWNGADNTVVDMGHLVDPLDHSRLPASPAARREIGLAIAGLRPTCRSIAAQGIDRIVSSTAERVEDRAGQELTKQIQPATTG